ncbi:OB-fold nucleic acid binding domain-containing protein, partial [Streptomyces globisporus]|uniref:OB-fold nucleic acid binding domain-containing protein n=2 Tax=Streptomyces griseus group TaxID=629295 RepID=UPI0034603D93
AEGQPYTSLQDFYARAHPKLPTVERLISIGALDQLKGGASRRDLLLQATELHRQARTRPGAGQLPLATAPHAAGSSGLREMTARERLDAELGVLKIDVSRHLMEDHHRLLREIGATDAKHLRAMHPGQRVLVAGVRASTQTPPIASGKRIIFVTLEDGSGLVDLAFFEDSHERCAHTVFHHGLLLVRGTVEARGPRRTVVGEMAWDLDELAAARATHGPQAVLDLLGQAPSPTPAQPEPGRTIPDGTAGARLHPWSDLQPAGTRSADLTRFGHRSPGSPG